MQKQTQNPQTGKKTVITKDKDGNVKRIIAGTNEYTFNKKTHQWQTPKPKLPTEKQKAHQFAVKLRNRATPSEKLLSKLLRSIGISFHFQKTIKTDDGYRIADFFIPGLNWAIEIDGGYHNTVAQQEKDAIRTEHIVKTTGYKIIRFTNDEVDKNPKRVVEVIIHGIRTKLLEVLGGEDTFTPICVETPLRIM